MQSFAMLFSLWKFGAVELSRPGPDLVLAVQLQSER